uniref:Uncharacterized protein n=1 Tax=Heterorhabditis bacteriophora TaxID=37862 RepID=A0A1I7WEX6_HETBA
MSYHLNAKMIVCVVVLAIRFVLCISICSYYYNLFYTVHLRPTIFNYNSLVVILLLIPLVLFVLVEMRSLFLKSFAMIQNILYIYLLFNCGYNE